MKVKILSLLLAGSMPLTTIHAQALSGRAHAQAYSALLKILPSKNSFAYALFGGAALAAAAVVAYKALTTTDVQKLNRIISLLDKELSRFFYTLKLYQSEDDFTKFYTLFSREYAYLKQYDIAGITSESSQSQFPAVGDVIPILLKQNPKLKDIIDKIRTIDTKLLSKSEQDDLIKKIEFIAYQISQFFNYHVKDARPWYRKLTNPTSHPLNFTQKEDILIPLAINIRAIEDLLKGKTLRGSEKLFYPDQLTRIFDASRKLLDRDPKNPMSDNKLNTFITEAAPDKADL